MSDKDLQRKIDEAIAKLQTPEGREITRKAIAESREHRRQFEESQRFDIQQWIDWNTPFDR